MTDTFRNAYHFIPRDDKGDHPEFTADHHIYTGLSGHIRCTITLEQPTVIGAKHVKSSDDYNVVHQFTYQGKPAIPATSIKGLISSIAEAASLSAYRVLADEKLTVRDGANKRAFPSTVYDYVPAELLPLSKDRERKISLAEQIFGFVIDGEKGEGSAFAGRVRPSIGVLTDHAANADPYVNDGDYHCDGQNWVRLKELSQPMKEWTEKKTQTKYRSATPNFYMKENAGLSESFIGKAAFADKGAGVYEIQGQKAYLHHLHRDTADQQPWKTAATAIADQTRDGNKGIAAGRKSVVRPIKAKVEFTFTLSFDNLTPAMLDLLCFALRPSERFRHKIGYGKSIGVGSVKIDPVKLELIDRPARYKSDARQSAGRRRHRRWLWRAGRS